jgi:hypothetical protein
MSHTIEFLNCLATELQEQDNAYTASPIYCIQEEVLVTGIDTEYCETIGWFSSDGGGLADARKARALNRYYDRYGKEPADWVRTGYEYVWRYTGRSYLTKAAAAAFVGDSKKHRVYVDSAYRNRELKEIRRLLSGPLAACVQALQQADKFITNGIDLGYIRMPDADCPDPAHATPGAIKTALALLETAKEPNS